jgi:16S rRNA (guanine527-N7)-methyltransferase
MELLAKYFPNLTPQQNNQFSELFDLYVHWNAQINVISRKDMDSFYERHVIHSLAISKIMEFTSNSTILDIGTGGGFPGIPLAILYPEVNFHLVDSIGKKIKVVNEVSTALKLTNVHASHIRGEEINEQFDFIVSRAVTAMPAFLPWTKGKFKKENINSLKNGILYLKGGDLTEELKTVTNKHTIYPLNEVFEESFFETKSVVYIKCNS